MPSMRSRCFGVAFVVLAIAAFAPLGNVEAAKGGNGGGGGGSSVSDYVGSAVCSNCHLGKHETWSQTAHNQILRSGADEKSYINDGNVSGHSDFFDGADIAITSLPGGGSFSSYGQYAPVLGKDKNKGPYIKIGGKTYLIAYTVGGSAVQNPTVADSDGNGRILNDEAQYKQLYVTMIGKSNYVLPVQFNAKSATYAPYAPEHWYDASNLPIVNIDVNLAYERTCAGCHSTGVQIAQSSGQWTMTMVDTAVACEACHGPGRAHIDAPTVALKKATIVNPETLLATTDLNDDGNIDTVDHLLARNFVCYSCHSQGTGSYMDSNNNPLLYPSIADASGNALLYRPGQDLRGYFTISQDPNNYWGAHDENGNEMIDYGEFIASTHGSQQRQDHASGPHAADKVYDHACFTCHELHEADRLHLVTTENEGVPVPQPNDRTAQRNNLCLSCHATHGDFASLTEQDLIDGTSNITTVVRAHVKNRAFMDVSFQTRCISCHMPDTAKTAVEGDAQGHVFLPIWPGYVMQPADFKWDNGFEAMGMGFELVDGFQVGLIPNSCTGCHEPGNDDDIVTQWLSSGHADGHGEPFNHWNGEGEVQNSCARCHSQGGFKQLADSSVDTDPGKPTPAGVPWYTLTGAGGTILPDYNAPTNGTVTAQSAIYPKVLNCNTCHEENGGGETVYEAGKLQEVAFPSGVRKTLGNSSNICMQCHQGRESGLSVLNANPSVKDPACTANPPPSPATCPNVYYRFINEHYFAEAATMFGTEVTAGYEEFLPAGMTYLGKNQFLGHSAVGKQDCVGCHLNKDMGPFGVEKDHNFFPEAEDCSSCHYGNIEVDGHFTGLGKPYGNPNVDYDGNGIRDSFRHEVDGMQAHLILAMNAYAKVSGLDAIIYTPGAYPYWAKASCYLGDAGCNPVPQGGSYVTFNKPLLGAAYNYHSAQDPGAGIHNHKYMIQILYDSIAGMGGSVAGLTRP